MISRRAFITSGASIAAVGMLPRINAIEAAERPAQLELVAGPGQANLLAGEKTKTAVWAYNGAAPGPILRATQGETLNVRLLNKLTQPTSLHWHGVRLDNRMDGVPGLTQKAVAPGESFDYAVKCPDAGTFWYHPHILASEQVARGLHGIIVVDEKEPPKVDKDVVLAFDDWRLMSDAQIHAASFGAIGERAHGGRYGNTFTINGTTDYKLAARAGERIRLRLCNVSNANIFGIRFEAHAPTVIAVDGQPVAPNKPVGNVIVLASGQRNDVILDMTGNPGSRSEITLITFNEERAVGEIVYDKSPAVRTQPLDAPIALPANPLDTKLDLGSALDASLVMEGGAMRGLPGAWVGKEWLGMRDLIKKHGYIWSFNGRAGMPPEPLFRAKRGQTVKLRMVNRTYWPHAMHLHGHHYKQIAGPPKMPLDPHWRDTIVLSAEEEFTMAFVADNPGKWMLHCHMLEHQAGGMATWFEVTA